MKKFLTFIFIFCLALLIINAQYINITSPTSGDEWITGSTYNITWERSGIMHSLVKIRLYSAEGIKVLDIVENTDNDGIYEGWRIPGSLSDGNYNIRVKTIDNGVSSISYTFNITKRVSDETHKWETYCINLEILPGETKTNLWMNQQDKLKI